MWFGPRQASCNAGSESWPNLRSEAGAHGSGGMTVRFCFCLLLYNTRAKALLTALQPLMAPPGHSWWMCSICWPSHPPEGLLGLLHMRNAFLSFRSEQAPRRNVIKFKNLMKYLILHHFLCFYLVSKTEPIYKQRP